MNRILQGDVFEMLPTLEPGSVDCAVTSPPYWALRSYLPKGHALKHLELGSEKTPAEYIAKMVAVFELVKRALAEWGTCWVNIGDTYWTAKGSCYNPGGGPMSKLKTHKDVGAHPLHRGNKSDLDIGSGNLCLIPQRLAIALQDAVAQARADAAERFGVDVEEASNQGEGARMQRYTRRQGGKA